jgi:hypothetical protein
MPRKRELLKRKAWADDPRVPIHPAVLKAVLDERGWGPSELAHRIGRPYATQQNLSHLLKSGGTRKCRASLRRRIAKVLEVAEDFLAAEPTIPPYHPFDAEGFEYRYSAQTKLAASRLLTLIWKAVILDIEKDRAERGASYPFPPGHLTAHQALNWLCELFMVRPWREKLLMWRPGVESQRGYFEPPWQGPGEVRSPRLRQLSKKEGVQYPKGVQQIMSWEATPPKPTPAPDHEAAILAMIRAAEHLLRPWFDGEADLNYASVRDFAHLPKHPFAGIPEVVPETSPLAVWQPQSLSSQPVVATPKPTSLKHPTDSGRSSSRRTRR